MDALLAAALGAPLAGAAVLRLVRPPAVVARWTAAGMALLWLAVAVGDGARIGRFAADGPVAAAGAGGALLVAALHVPGPRTLVALAAAMAGVTAALGGGHAGDALAGLAVATFAGGGNATARRAVPAPPLRSRLRPAVRRAAAALWHRARGAGWHRAPGAVWHHARDAPWAVAGLAALTAAAARSEWETGGLSLTASHRSWLASVLVAAAGGAFALAGTRRPLTGHAVLLPAALALAVGTAGPAGAPAVAVGLGATGALVAWGVPRSLRARGPANPAGALALWCLAAAFVAEAGGAAAGTAPLLGAAAVLTAVTGLVGAAVAAAPAGAVMAIGLRDEGTGWALAVALLAVVTAAALAAAPVARRRRPAPLRAAGRPDPDPTPLVLRVLPPPRAASGVAAVLAGWLLVAPGTWGWASPPAFGSWSRTSVAALPVAAATLAAAWRVGLVRVADLYAAPLPVSGGGRSRLNAAAVLAALGAAGTWLVLSLVRGR